MRPIETLLLLANLLTLVLLAVSLPRAARWMRSLSLIPLVIAGAQALLDGPRWQMIPAYALSGVFLLVWLLGNIERAGRPADRRRANRLAARVLVGAGVLGLAVSVAVPAIFPAS